MIKEMIILFPVIVLSYFVIEWLIHRYNSLHIYKKITPFLGAIFASLPTCSTNVIASELYVQKMISLGTLMSIFVASNDEAIFLLLFGSHFSWKVLSVFMLKFVVGVVLGMIINHKIVMNHESVLVKEHHHSIYKHVLKHSIKIFIYIVFSEWIVSFVMELIGEYRLYRFLKQSVTFQPIIAGVIGLIPSCAGSLLLSFAYLKGLISLGSLFSGLCCSVGLGLVTLFKLEKNRQYCFMILLLLYFTSVFIGYMVY